MATRIIYFEWGIKASSSHIFKMRWARSWADNPIDEEKRVGPTLGIN